jgi:transposase InsO family protein
MESFHDYKMVANKSIVEQTHEIQRLAKELELFKYVIPNEVVVGCTIAKLPSPWRNFATSLKHKRVKITVANLIQSLDVEEKARVKDNTDKGNEEHSASAHFVQKNFKGKNKGKLKQQPFNVKATTTFKKKKKKDKSEMMNGVLTKGGKRYFMTLIDDASRYCCVYLLKTKEETLDYFKIFKVEAENQLERKIKFLRSDRGGEYFPISFDEFCAEHGIIHERTPPYSLESNGIAERKNRTLTDLVNTMLDTVGLSKAWWGKLY